MDGLFVACLPGVSYSRALKLQSTNMTSAVTTLRGQAAGQSTVVHQ